MISDKILVNMCIIEMTTVFSTVPLILYSRVLQHPQRSTENGKEQSEYANSKAQNKAIFCIWLCQLLDACSKQPQVFIRFSSPIKPPKLIPKEIMQKIF